MVSPTDLRVAASSSWARQAPGFLAGLQTPAPHDSDHNTRSSFWFSHRTPWVASGRDVWGLDIASWNDEARRGGCRLYTPNWLGSTETEIPVNLAWAPRCHRHGWTNSWLIGPTRQRAIAAIERKQMTNGPRASTTQSRNAGISRWPGWPTRQRQVKEGIGDRPARWGGAVGRSVAHALRENRRSGPENKIGPRVAFFFQFSFLISD
jgi:hypothetical protein